MHLDKWLEKEGKTQADFGAMLTPTVTQGTVSHWVVGRHRMPINYADQTDRITNGEVSMRDCADMYTASEPEPAKAA